MTAELLLRESQEHTRQLQEHTRQLQEHTRQLRLDGEHIRGVVRIAELHHERLSGLEPW